jgi:hypothetical protein
MSFFKSILIIILIVTNLTSCTKRLWKKSYYVENFTNFMATNDGKKIVILGKKYHYIFDDESQTLFKLLSWINKSKLEIENYNFRLSEINKITGSITIKSKAPKNSDEDLNEEDISFLNKFGFTSDGNIFKKNIILSGQRYSPKSGVNYDKIDPLNKEYKFNVEVSDYVDRTKKIVLTPVAVAIDGAIIALLVLSNKETGSNKSNDYNQIYRLLNL